MPIATDSTLPASLVTGTPADGQRLACQLATDLLASLPAKNTMPESLSTQAATRPAPEVVSAIYFHAISIANGGWKI